MCSRVDSCNSIRGESWLKLYGLPLNIKKKGGGGAFLDYLSYFDSKVRDGKLTDDGI